MRTFAIVNLNDITSDLRHCVALAKSLPSDSEVYICTTNNGVKRVGQKLPENIKTLAVYEESDNDATKHNRVLKHFKGTKGFLHVIEDEVIVNASSIGIYLNDIENMMNTFNYSIKLCNATDRCNFVYNRFEPRVKIILDRHEFMSVGLSSLLFTSHANTAWITYNLDKIDIDASLFDERFSIPMFWIIKFLAERRNNVIGKSITYMNMYPTVDTEAATISTDMSVKAKRSDDNMTMAKEDALFKSMNLDITPMNNVDKILEDIYEILKETSK